MLRNDQYRGNMDYPGESFGSLVSRLGENPEITYRNGTKGIRINEEIDININTLKRMDGLLRRYETRPEPKARAERRRDCLDDQTIADYVGYELVSKAGNPNTMDKGQLSRTEAHLRECDYCFNMVLGAYGILVDMELEDQGENAGNGSHK